MARSTDHKIGLGLVRQLSSTQPTLMAVLQDLLRPTTSFSQITPALATPTLSLPLVQPDRKQFTVLGESQTVTGNGSSNSWVIAYDNVTGAGAGSAGDINVTIVGPNYTGALGSMTSRGTAYTVTADDAVIEIVGVVQ